MSYFSKRLVIHPEDNNDVAYWTKKWGVNVRQIDDAILETGSINLEDIRNVLLRKGQLHGLWAFLYRLFRGWAITTGHPGPR